MKKSAQNFPRINKNMAHYSVLLCWEIVLKRRLTPCHSWMFSWMLNKSQKQKKGFSLLSKNKRRTF